MSTPDAVLTRSVSSPSAASREAETRTAVDIAPATRWPRVDLPELWAHRELFLFLVWRDVKVRYAQTVLGAGWVVLQPLITTVVFTLVFGGLAKIPSDGAPYALFALAALVPWTYFASALNGASLSLIANANLIQKVYFPRLVVPLASVLGGLVNFGITLGILLVAMFVFGRVPSLAAVIVIPVLLLLTMMLAAGVGSWLGAIAMQYRDMRNIVLFLVQLWMYASPVVYPLSLVSPEYRTVYMLNPMVGVIEGFRAVLLRTAPLPLEAIALSAAIATLTLVTGVLWFWRMEQTLADVA